MSTRAAPAGSGVPADVDADPGGYHRHCDHGAGLGSIGSVAARTRVSERTLRYYEEVGLLAPAARRPGGSRCYCEADVEKVLRIRELQALMGFNLEEIRAVVDAEDRLDDVRDRYRRSPDGDQQRRVAEEGIQALEDLRSSVQAKLDRLGVFLAELDARIARHRQRLGR